MRAVCAKRKKRVLCAVMRVDLNPVRAAMADTLMESDHTSVPSRLKEREESRQPKKNLLERPSAQARKSRPAQWM